MSYTVAERATGSVGPVLTGPLFEEIIGGQSFPLLHDVCPTYTYLLKASPH